MLGLTTLHVSIEATQHLATEQASAQRWAVSGLADVLPGEQVNSKSDGGRGTNTCAALDPDRKS
jgi:hypothetical protein